jgi:hypothetical protein
MTKIQARFAYTPDDYAEAVQAWIKHLAPAGPRFVARWITLAIVFVFGLGCLLVYVQEDKRIVASCFAYGVLLVLYYWVFDKARLRRRFRKFRSLQGEMTVELNDEQFKITNAMGTVSTVWNVFTKYMETQNLFILATASPYYYFPKRALSDADLTAVRWLLTGKFRTSTGT